MNSAFQDYNVILNQIMSENWYIITEFFTGVVIDVILYLFLSFGILTLARRHALKNRWLSFIPFFNLTLLGELLGKTNIWGIKVKNIGFWAGLFTFLSFVANEILYVYKYINVFQAMFNVQVVFENEALYGWVTGKSLAWTIVNFSTIIVDLPALFFEVGLIFLFFRVFAPQRAFLYSILSVFIDPLFSILVFVCRKNSKFVYVRADFFNQYNAHRNNQNPNGGSQQNKRSPFSEFEDDNNNNNSSDDYFN